MKNIWRGGKFWEFGHGYQVLLYPDETGDGLEVSTVICEFGIEANGDLSKYEGKVYFDDNNTANTNTVLGVDGLPPRFVPSWAAAQAFADALGTKHIHVRGRHDVTGDALSYAFSATIPDRDRVNVNPVDFLVNSGQDIYENCFGVIRYEGKISIQPTTGDDSTLAKQIDISPANQSNDDGGEGLVSADLTSSTNLQANRAESAVNTKYTFFVINFRPFVNNAGLLNAGLVNSGLINGGLAQV